MTGPGFKSSDSQQIMIDKSVRSCCFGKQILKQIVYNIYYVPIFQQCETPRFDPWVGKIPGEGKGYPLQYSLENSLGCIVYGVAKSWTGLNDCHFTSFQSCFYIYWFYICWFILYIMFPICWFILCIESAHFLHPDILRNSKWQNAKETWGCPAFH